MREEDERRVAHDDGGRAQCLRDTGEVELVHLLEAPLVDVGQPVDGAVDEHPHRQREHLGVVAAQRAVQKAHDEHGRAREHAVCLVVGKGVRLVDVGDLEGAHTVVGDEEQKRARDERHREAAGGVHVDELRGHDRQDGKDHAPGAQAHGVPDVVARGLVGGVLLGLARERAGVDGADEAVPPPADEPGHAAGLPGLARRPGLAPEAGAARAAGVALVEARALRGARHRVLPVVAAQRRRYAGPLPKRIA